MKILIAEDDRVVRHILQRLLSQEYELVSASDGLEAWEVLAGDGAPRLAVLDWQMPGMDGTEICRKLRASPELVSTYVILLTAVRTSPADLLAGFEAGADDYITKPFNRDELLARVAVGRRMLQLQQTLAERVAELQEALVNVRRLQGLIPMCSWCKRIRNDQSYWQQVETYVSEHSEATFTHGICPECRKKYWDADLLPAAASGESR